jgi:enamine deaminase RidA (YjgF/YER057c/UK114 family)
MVTRKGRSGSSVRTPPKRRFISSESSFEKLAGYSRMVVDSDWIFSAGTTGFDYTKMTISNSLEQQVEQAIENIRNFLAKADATLQDVVQCNWVITKREYFASCGKLLSKAFFPNEPAMMTLVCDLVDKKMKFEIQIVARTMKKRKRSTKT